jgi:hypothetical protein
MNVRVYGFELIPGKGITMPQFFEFLKTRNGREIDNRVVCTFKNGDYWQGLLITIKDVKNFCQLKKSGKGFKVTPQELEAGTSMVDFNFFIVYEPTSRGLYQWYHHSTGLSTFCAFLKQQYNVLKNDLVNGEIAVSQADRNAVAKVQKKYANSLGYSAMYRKESLEKKINELDRVTAVQMEAFSLEPISANDPLIPVLRVAKRRVERFTFQRDIKEQVKSAVIELVQHEPKGFRLEGVDPDGIEQTYKLLNDHDILAEYDYDEVVQTVEIDSNDLVGSIEKSQLSALLTKLANGKAKALLQMRAVP